MNKTSDDFLLKRGFYRTLALHGEHELYRTAGHICSGLSLDIDKKLLSTLTRKNQNTILARALPINREKYSELIKPYFHHRRLSTFAGIKTIQPFGIFTDGTYYLYKAHYALANQDVTQAITWLNKHVSFHLSPRHKIDDFFNDTEFKKKQQELKGPVISVVFCAKNEETHLKRALVSLLNQTWARIELVFINDGSTDQTVNIFNQYRDHFYASQYIETTGVGLWQAKNLGLKQVTGQYVTFHDADDWSHPKKLELQIKPLLKNPNLKATTSLNIRISQSLDALCTKNAMFLQRLNPSSLMFSSQALPEIGYFFDDLLAADIEYIRRFQLVYGLGAYKAIQYPLMLGTARPNGLSNLHHGIEGKRIKDWEMWNLLHNNHSRILKKQIPDGTRFKEYISQNNLQELMLS